MPATMIPFPLRPRLAGWWRPLGKPWAVAHITHRVVRDGELHLFTLCRRSQRDATYEALNDYPGMRQCRRCTRLLAALPHMEPASPTHRQGEWA